MNVIGILGSLFGNQSQVSQTVSPLLVNVLMTFLGNPHGQLTEQNNEPNLANGIGTLVNMFEQSGLSNQVQSWIGTGANHPIEASDIMQVLGNTKVAELAQQLGVDPELASAQIAHYLPILIDSFTPNGELPQNVDQVSSIATQLLDALKKA